MFTTIINPTLLLYDGNTGQYLGTATFDLPPEEELKLLNLVNFSVEPSTLLVLDANLYNAPENYVPPSITELLRRRAIIRADFRDENTNYTIPIDIRIEFDSRARGPVPGNPYFFNSIQFSNIFVDSITRLE